jgi:hypothetical protein
MSNHIHLALQQGNEGLSTAIQNFAFRYAQRINRFRKEVGHVFQGRFKSILVNKENYLIKLVRYIHLNPVRAGIVNLPEDYKWSGHNAYLGTDPVTWVEHDYILKRYSECRDVAIRKYNEFIHNGIGYEPEINFRIGLKSGIIGDDAFIQTILAKANEHDRYDNVNISISEVIKYVCLKYSVSENEISSPSRTREVVHVRAVIALLARDLRGISITEAAKKLKRDAGGLSRLAAKLDKECNNTSLLKQEIVSLKNELLGNNMKKNSESLAIHL